MEGRPRTVAGPDRPPVLIPTLRTRRPVMPTSKGRRALVASLLMLLACLSSGFVSALADEFVADPAPETPPATTATTVTATPPEPVIEPDPSPVTEPDPVVEPPPSTTTTSAP